MIEYVVPFCMRHPTPLKLRKIERQQSQSVVNLPSARAGHARRAQSILLAADGLRNIDIAQAVGLNPQQVSRIRHCFIRGGVKALEDKPRPGRGNNVPEDMVRKVITTVMGPPPVGHSHWSTRELGHVVGLGHTAVHDILRANDLKPHLQRTFKVSRDPKFAEKVDDVVGLYLNPPKKAVVLCVDEKTQVQALERTQRMLPLRAGQIETRTHDYRRHGVLDLFAALEIRTGQVVGECRESHTAQDFLAFLKLLNRRFPNGDLHVVLDNSSSHKTEEVWNWVAKHPRVHLHFTPTSASWMNQVEGFFSILTRRSIRRANFPSKAALRRHIELFLSRWNENPTPFTWTKSAKTIVRDHRRISARISRT
jgi:transposase